MWKSRLKSAIAGGLPREKGLELLFLIGVAATVVFVIASYEDLRHRSIPNYLPAVLAGTAVVKWIVIGQLASALWALAAAAIVLAVTGFMFAQGWLGGGDVKLLTAAVLLIGAPDAPALLLGMAVIGGVLSLAMLLWRARPGGADAKPTVPYGVAIALAAIAIIALDGRGVWII